MFPCLGRARSVLGRSLLITRTWRFLLMCLLRSGPYGFQTGESRPCRQGHSSGEGTLDSPWRRGGDLGARGPVAGAVPQGFSRCRYDFNFEDEIPLSREVCNILLIRQKNHTNFFYLYTRIYTRIYDPRMTHLWTGFRRP